MPSNVDTLYIPASTLNDLFYDRPDTVSAVLIDKNAKVTLLDALLHVTDMLVSYGEIDAPTGDGSSSLYVNRYLAGRFVGFRMALIINSLTNLIGDVYVENGVSFVNASDIIVFNGFHFEIQGDFNLSSGIGAIDMRYASDVLSTTGHASFDGNASNMNISGGKILLQGNLNVLTGANKLTTTGNSVITFEGSGNSNINILDPINNNIAHLEINKLSSTDTVRLLSNLEIAGGRLDIFTGNLLMNGNAFHTYDLNVDGASAKLLMLNPLDSILAFNAHFNSASNSGTLTDGAIKISGDLVIDEAYGPDALYSEQNHKIIFLGSSTQTITHNASANNVFIKHAIFNGDTIDADFKGYISKLEQISGHLDFSNSLTFNSDTIILNGSHEFDGIGFQNNHPFFPRNINANQIDIFGVFNWTLTADDSVNSINFSGNDTIDLNGFKLTAKNLSFGTNSYLIMNTGNPLLETDMFTMNGNSDLTAGEIIVKQNMMIQSFTPQSFEPKNKVTLHGRNGDFINLTVNNSSPSIGYNNFENLFLDLDSAELHLNPSSDTLYVRNLIKPGSGKSIVSATSDYLLYVLDSISISNIEFDATRLYLDGFNSNTLAKFDSIAFINYLATSNVLTITADAALNTTFNDLTFAGVPSPGFYYIDASSGVPSIININNLYAEAYSSHENTANVTINRSFRTQFHWTGRDNDDWNNFSNWSNSAKPFSIVDTVHIETGSIFYPRFAGIDTISSLYLNDNTFLNIPNTGFLTVSNEIAMGSSSNIHGGGIIKVGETGRISKVSGYFGLINVLFEGQVDLTGDLNSDSVLTHISTPDAQLNVGGFNLSARDLNVSERLFMNNPSDFVSIYGNFTYIRNYVDANLADGLIEAHGNFFVTGTGFKSNNTVRIIGPGNQMIFLDSASLAESHFGNLDIQKSTGSVFLQNGFDVTGDFNANFNPLFIRSINKQSQINFHGNVDADIVELDSINVHFDHANIIRFDNIRFRKIHPDTDQIKITSSGLDVLFNNLDLDTANRASGNYFNVINDGGSPINIQVNPTFQADYQSRIQTAGDVNISFGSPNSIMAFEPYNADVSGPRDFIKLRFENNISELPINFRDSITKYTKIHDDEGFLYRIDQTTFDFMDNGKPVYNIRLRNQIEHSKLVFVNVDSNLVDTASKSLGSISYSFTTNERFGYIADFKKNSILNANLGINLSDVKSFDSFVVNGRTFLMIFYYESNQLRLILQELDDDEPRVIFNNVVLNSVSSSIKIKSINKARIVENGKKLILIDYLDAGRQALQQIDFTFLQVDASFELGTGLTNPKVIYYDQDDFPEIYAVDTVNNQVLNFTNYNPQANSYNSRVLLNTPSFDESAHLEFAYIGDSTIKLALLTHQNTGMDSVKIYDLEAADSAKHVETHFVDLSAINKILNFKYRITSSGAHEGEGPSDVFFFIGDNQTQFKKLEDSLFMDDGFLNHNNLKSFDAYFLTQFRQVNAIYAEQDTLKFLTPDTSDNLLIKGHFYNGFTAYSYDRGARNVINLDPANGMYHIFSQDYLVGDRIKVGPTEIYKTFAEAAIDPNFQPGAEIYFSPDPTKDTTFILVDSISIDMPLYITASDSVVLRPMKDSIPVFRVTHMAEFGRLHNIRIFDTIPNDEVIGVYLDDTNFGFEVEDLHTQNMKIGIKNHNSGIGISNFSSINNQYGIYGLSDQDRFATIEVEQSVFENSMISAISAHDVERIELDSVEFRHINSFISDRTMPLIQTSYGNSTNNDFRVKIEKSFFRDLDKKIIVFKDTSDLKDFELDFVENFVENTNTAGQSNELLEVENSKLFLGNNIFRNNHEPILTYSTTSVNDTNYILSNVFDSHQQATGIVMNIDIPADSLVQIFNSVFLNAQSPRIVRLGTGRFLYGYTILSTTFLSTEFATWGIHHNPEPYFNIFENVPVSNYSLDYRFKANSLGLDIGLDHPNYKDPDGSRSNIGNHSGSFIKYGLTEQTNILLTPSKDSISILPFVNSSNITNLDKYYIVSGDSLEAYVTASALTIIDSTNNQFFDLGPKTNSDAYYTVAASHQTDGILSRSNIVFRQANAELVEDTTNFTINANTIDSVTIIVQNHSNSMRFSRFTVSGDPGAFLNTSPRQINPGLDSIKLYINSNLLVNNNNTIIVNMNEAGSLLDQQVIQVTLNAANNVRFTRRSQFSGLLRGTTGRFSTLIRNPSLSSSKINVDAKSFAPLNDVSWLNYPDSLSLQGADSIAFTFEVNTAGVNANLNTLLAKLYLEENGHIYDSLSLIVRIGNILQLSFTEETKNRLSGDIYQSGFITNWLSTNNQVEYELQLLIITNSSTTLVQSDTVSGSSFAYNNLNSGDYKLLLSSTDTNFVSNTDSLRFRVNNKQINYNASYWQLISSNVDLSNRTSKEMISNYNGQVYRWDELLLDYVAVNDTSIDNGKAYWFKPTNTGSITYTENSIAPDASPTITLKKGWNQVGNPWNWPIHWGSQEVSFDNGATFSKVSIVDIEKFYGVHYLTTVDFPELKAILRSDSSFVFEPINITTLDGFSYLPNSRGVWVYSETASVVRFSNVQIPENVTNTVNIKEVDIRLVQNNYHSEYKINIDEQINREKNVYRPPSLGQLNPMVRKVNGKETFAVYTSLKHETVHEYDFKLKGKLNQVSDFNFEMPDETGLYLWVYHIQSGTRERFEGSASLKLKNRTENDHIKVFLTSDSSFEPEIIPTEHRLDQNFPNPFNPVTTIKFDLPFSEGKFKTKLVVYNLLGQKVKTLFSGYLNFGSHSFKWNGDNDLGGKVASGIYFYQLQAGRFSQAKKMILVK